MAMAMGRAMARVMAMARTKDRPRLGLELWSVFTFKRPDRFCRRTKFYVTDPRFLLGGVVLCSLSRRALFRKGCHVWRKRVSFLLLNAKLGIRVNRVYYSGAIGV